MSPTSPALTCGLHTWSCSANARHRTCRGHAQRERFLTSQAASLRRVASSTPTPGQRKRRASLGSVIVAESLVDPVAAAEHAHHVVPKRKRRGTIGIPVRHVAVGARPCAMPSHSSCATTGDCELSAQGNRFTPGAQGFLGHLEEGRAHELGGSHAIVDTAEVSVRRPVPSRAPLRASRNVALSCGTGGSRGQDETRWASHERTLSPDRRRSVGRGRTCGAHCVEHHGWSRECATPTPPRASVNHTNLTLAPHARHAHTRDSSATVTRLLGEKNTRLQPSGRKR